MITILRFSINWGKGSKPARLAMLIVGLLCLATVGTVGIQPLAQTHAPAVPANVQPILAQMATDQPDSLVSVIVQKRVKDGSLEEMVVHLGGTVTTDLSIINAFAAEMKAKDVPQLALANGVKWVSLDAPVKHSSGPIDTSTMASAYIQAVRADRVWNKGPAYLQGQGVTVAVVDSGNCINSGTPCDDLTDPSGASHVKAAVSVIADNKGDPFDYYGHGSLVEGLVGGTGLGSNGEYFGVAPNVNLVSVRIADQFGRANTSDVVNGLQWVLNNKDTYNIRVVNLSLDSSVLETYNTSPLDAACEILWFNGIVVVVSAGNNGTGSLYAPANDPFVITVGATDDKGTATLGDDSMATFSAYGTDETGAVKPDLVAPGKNLISIIPKNKNRIWKTHQSNYTGQSGAYEYYMRVSGTSFSAPIVAGAAAILLQSNPNLNPDQVKYRLMATANRSWPGYNAAMAGAGYLDIYAAVHGTSTESANTNLLISSLLFTGSNSTWSSANWNSANWNSANWNSANWNSVDWNSVDWNSDYWGP